jgi:anoctamin-10
VFVKVENEDVLANVVYRSRMRDWLYGITQIQPVKNAVEALTREPLTNAERLRHIHHMINHPKSDGGAGITPRSGDWKNVESIFPLHDHAMNKKWMSEFSRKTFLTPEDLDEVKDNMGEKVSLLNLS